ncbi:MAG TPA: hypothetical protein VJI32_05085 [Candidatus Nanoarchaeia archaeon]|nr:hypothetical protein [Candidatus Nanoarchaeia archaeon]
MAHIEVKRHWKLILLTVILTITGIFFIKPAVLGYSVYQDLQRTNLTAQEYGQSIDEIQEELHISNATLTSYAVFNEQLLYQVTQMTQDIALKSAELARLNAKMEEAERVHAQKVLEIQDELNEQENDATVELTRAQAQLQNLTAAYTQTREEKEAEIKQITSQQDLFIAQTARSICCKEKVDDESIDSYEVVNNKIMCLQEGNRSLSC